MLHSFGNRQHLELNSDAQGGGGGGEEGGEGGGRQNSTAQC